MSTATRFRTYATSCLLTAAIALPTGCGGRREKVDLSPASWGEAQLKKYVDLGGGPAYRSSHQVPVVGTQGMVTGTSGVVATHVGLETLEKGGSAADAAIATMLVQTVLTAGSAISFAGIMTMVYYDAQTGQARSLNAGFNTVRDELDPMSIPGIDLLQASESGNVMEAIKTMAPSGRTALVPGFMAGLEAAHDRFGKLPWATLFEPAIYLAENGIPVDAFLEQAIATNSDVLSRLPATKSVFTKSDGSSYGAGDTFRQTALAATLKRVASDGARYMYTGDWAKKLVEAVRADGGTMTMQDLTDYRVLWSEPIRSTYKNYEIDAYGLPASGGVHTVEALNLLEQADLGRFGDRYWDSAEALYWFSNITGVNRLSFLTQEEREAAWPGVDLSLAARTTKETARWEWQQIQAAKGAFPQAGSGAGPRHSAAVVAVDRWGNVAAAVQSINTIYWGRTGIFIDGVSIPDSAWFQQKEIAKAGPGQRLPDPTNPCIVFRDGRPYLGSSSIGSSLHHQTVQGLYDVMEYGLDPNQAASSPTFMAAGFSDAGMSVVEGEFVPKVVAGVKEMGIDVQPAPTRPRFWLAVMIEPGSGRLLSSDATVRDASGQLVPMGLAEGY